MAFSLLAESVVPTIYDIDIEALARRGVTLLLADLDNTLVAYGVATATHQARAWKDRLAALGITLFVLSNNRSATRAKHFCQDLDVPFIGHAGKPRGASFRRAMEQMGRTAAQTVMVGDQVFTDVLGAKNGGISAILVQPIRLAGNPGRYLRYAVELPFRAIAKERMKRI